jgi:hypothetical protein
MDTLELFLKINFALFFYSDAEVSTLIHVCLQSLSYLSLCS